MTNMGSKHHSGPEEKVDRLRTEPASQLEGSTTASTDDGLIGGVPEKLVSETALEEPSDDELGQPPQAPIASDIPPELNALREELEAQEFSPEVRQRPRLDGDFELHFDLIAGRSTREVVVPESSAQVLRGIDVSSWRSLHHFDGIWSEREGVIEVIVRGQRFGMSLSHLRRRLPGSSKSDSGQESEESEIELAHPHSTVSLRIGDATDIASVLLSDSRRSNRRPMTLRISNIAVSTSDEADSLAKQVADAVSIEIDVATGVLLIPQRLESKEFVRKHRARRDWPVRFPRSGYPHAPVLLYQAGRDISTTPLTRFWSFYQVLEYFFPQHNQAEAVRQLSRHLRSPAFDPHRHEDILRAVELAASAGRGSSSEEEQLLVTLRAIVTAQEVVDLANDCLLSDQLENRNSELTEKALKLTPGDDLMSGLAHRIYDIRCRIVHSKSGGNRQGGPGLLPGTHHDDLVRNELPLMEFLAQQALIDAGERLVLPMRGAGDGFRSAGSR